MKLLNPRRLALIGLAVAASALTTIVIACNGDDNSNDVPVFDSGAPSGDTGVSANLDSSTDSSSSTNQDSSVPPSDGGLQPDTNVVILDSSLPDVGACISDAAVMYDAQVCNSCYTPADDPANGCSAYTVNCIPYDNSQVPAAAP